MHAAMRYSRAQRAPITRDVLCQRQQEAFSIKPEWERYASPEMLALISHYTIAVGCPKEFLFFPLLTSAAAMLGRNTKIRLTNMWSEPALLWCIVAARKGEKKSAAMRIIADAVRETERDAQEMFLQANPQFRPEEGEELSEEGQQQMPVFCMTNSQFTFSKLHDQMAKNEGECLLLYDEIAALYDQLDHQGSGSQCDRKILLSLYGGDPWSRSSKSQGTTTMEKTHFNYTGFMQPTIAINMLNVDDFDGFNDRHVAIICPQRDKVYFENLKPLPETTQSLSTLLTLLRRKHHDSEHTYVLGEEAETTFKKYYNDLEDRMEQLVDNEDHRGVLSKAQGQTARLALVLHTLTCAVEHRGRPYAEFTTTLTISKSIMDSAISLMEFCIKHKFALMSPLVTDPHTQDTVFHFEKVWETHPRNVKSLLLSEPINVDASFVAQRRLIPPQKMSNTVNKYPVVAAKAYLSVLAEAGLGDIVQPLESGKRRSAMFRKRKYDEMTEDAKAILSSLNVNEEEYINKFRRQDGITPSTSESEETHL